MIGTEPPRVAILSAVETVTTKIPSTIEAAACGLPQIVTRESGDVVQDGVNGIIIPPDDPDALARLDPGDMLRATADAGAQVRRALTATPTDALLAIADAAS